MDEEQESEDIAVRHLKKHINSLGPDVYAIHLSQDGELVSVSTDPEDDQGTCVYYPSLQDIQPFNHIKTVLRSDLLELDRLSPNVDLVSYTSCADGKEPKRAAFKYYFLFQFLYWVWDEMNLWMRLPPHPNLVPFDRIVLDELHGRIIGFTSLYIPGGTLSVGENKSRTFKLKWLRQLTCVIDDLNLKHGIVHQDVSGRNLVIDPKTDALMLFDWNYSGRIGGIGYGKDRNDIKGVIFTLYEIITRDTHFREVAHYKQNPADVQELDEWVQHPGVKLDHSVSEYRSVLNEWVDRRQNGTQITVYTEAPEYIDWPEFPKPPPKDIIFSAGTANPTENPTVLTMVALTEQRRDKRKEGIVPLNWERSAQIRLRDGDQVFANGHLVRSSEF